MHELWHIKVNTNIQIQVAYKKSLYATWQIGFEKNTLRLLWIRLLTYHNSRVYRDHTRTNNCEKYVLPAIIQIRVSRKNQVRADLLA